MSHCVPLPIPFLSSILITWTAHHVFPKYCKDCQPITFDLALPRPSPGLTSWCQSGTPNTPPLSDDVPSSAPPTALGIGYLQHCCWRYHTLPGLDLPLPVLTVPPPPLPSPSCPTQPLPNPLLAYWCWGASLQATDTRLCPWPDTTCSSSLATQNGALPFAAVIKNIGQLRCNFQLRPNSMGPSVDD